MKLGLLLLGLLTSAALAATSDTRFDVRALWRAEPPLPAMTPVDPPWLVAGVELPVEAHPEHAPHAAHDGDPHAAYHDGDPHAAYRGGNSHASYHDGDHPHAAHDGDNPHAAYHDGDPHARGVAPSAVAPLEPSRAANGRTVAGLFADRVKLSQTPVRVRATVVKLTDGILGKTYLHLQDGSGSVEGRDNDLTATTTETFELGETVEVEGRLAIDQDIGLGYVYEALLTDVVRVGPS